MGLFGLIIASALLQILVVQTIEVQHVQLGATVSLGCNLTSCFEMAWFRGNPHGSPTLVVYARLRKGDAIYEYQSEPHFTVDFVNRSLTITDIKQRDLGVYFCMAFWNTELLIGSGTVLQGPFHFGFYHWYCTVVGGGLLFMVVCVCVIQYKTKEHMCISSPGADEQICGEFSFTMLE